MVQKIFVVTVEFAAAARAYDQKQAREWVNATFNVDNGRGSGLFRFRRGHLDRFRRLLSHTHHYITSPSSVSIQSEHCPQKFLEVHLPGLQRVQIVESNAGYGGVDVKYIGERPGG